MERRNISLFRGYSDTESVETSLEEIVNIIKCDAALRDRTEKHRYYLQQDLRRDADREKSGCSGNCQELGIGNSNCNCEPNDSER